MLGWLLLFALGVGALVGASVGLAGAATRIASVTGVGQLFVGSLLLAGATSLPELMTNISAALADAPDLAVGDQFGSNMANMAILALIDLVHRGRVWPSVEIAHARVAAVAISLTAFATIAILAPTGPSIGWVGLDTVAILVAYVAAVAWFRRSPVLVRVGGLLPVRPPVEEPPAEEAADDIEREPLAPAVRTFAAAALAVLLAAPVVALSARELADEAGISESAVGAVLLAVATSLPELLASLAAVRIGAHDLAVGNLFGSNAANMAVLATTDLAYTDGPLLAAVDDGQVLAAVGSILLMSLAVAAIVTGRDTRIGRLEPDALLLLLAYAGIVAAVLAS